MQPAGRVPQKREPPVPVGGSRHRETRVSLQLHRAGSRNLACALRWTVSGSPDSTPPAAFGWLHTGLSDMGGGRGWHEVGTNRAN